MVKNAETISAGYLKKTASLGSLTRLFCAQDSNIRSWLSRIQQAAIERSQDDIAHKIERQRAGCPVSFDDNEMQEITTTTSLPADSFQSGSEESQLILQRARKHGFVGDEVVKAKMYIQKTENPPFRTKAGDFYIPCDHMTAGELRTWCRDNGYGNLYFVFHNGSDWIYDTDHVPIREFLQHSKGGHAWQYDWDGPCGSGKILIGSKFHVLPRWIMRGGIFQICYR